MKKTKKEYISELQAKGCKCVDDDGVIFVLPMEKYKDPKIRNTLTQLIKDIGYEGTWGMRPRKDENNA